MSFAETDNYGFDQFPNSSITEDDYPDLASMESWGRRPDSPQDLYHPRWDPASVGRPKKPKERPRGRRKKREHMTDAPPRVGISLELQIFILMLFVIVVVLVILTNSLSRIEAILSMYAAR